MEAIGSPDELAKRTATWFEAVLGKPIVRHEWEHNSQVYADRYLFADITHHRRSLTNAPTASTGCLVGELGYR
ncbi:hypothetical protein P3T29_002681 [Kitasatospora sp. MAP5-34]|nr:hypothetical protein [Kitasatospora sp. MAP5-34]